MNVDVHALNIEASSSLTDHVRRRVGSALDRFSQRVQRVIVRLSDVNGHRGGEDMQCQLQVDVLGCGMLIVEHTDSDVYAAVDQAADRVKRNVRRAIGKKRDSMTRQRRQPRA